MGSLKFFPPDEDGNFNKQSSTPKEMSADPYECNSVDDLDEIFDRKEQT